MNGEKLTLVQDKILAALDRGEGITLSPAELEELSAMFLELAGEMEKRDKEINRWIQAAVDAKKLMSSGEGTWKSRAAQALRRLWVLSTPGEPRINMRAFRLGFAYRQLVESGLDPATALEHAAENFKTSYGAARKLLQRNGVKGLPRD